MVTNNVTQPTRLSIWRERLTTRTGRRWLVLGLVEACVALILLGLLRVANPLSLVLIALLIAEDALLMYVTNRIAELPEGAIDERQEQMRNRAYRFAYRIVIHAVVWPAGLVVVLASYGDPHGWLHAFWSNTALVIAFGTSMTQLLVFLPTMILAWSQPDPIAPE